MSAKRLRGHVEVAMTISVVRDFFDEARRVDWYVWLTKSHLSPS